MTTVDRLNELLEAERAGVDTLSRLLPQAFGAEMRALFEGVRNDEAWRLRFLNRGQGWLMEFLDPAPRAA
jgi:hypothetical protein